MAGVELTWAGGEHNFHLTIGHLRALQQKCDAGPAWILARLGSNQWHVDDVLATIALGLEGGGMPKEQARKLVKQHVEDAPISLAVLTAQAVLMAALYGTPDDPVGEAQGEAKAPTHSPAADGVSPPSTEPLLF